MNSRNILLYISLLALQITEIYAQNLTVYRSNVSVQQTVQSLIKVIQTKGYKYFETVEHDKIARDRNVKISPTQVIIFEDVELSSQLIVCEQTSALDLPMKVMVWEEHGDVYIGYLDPILMRRKYLIDGCDETLKNMSSMMSRVVNETLRGS